MDTRQWRRWMVAVALAAVLPGWMLVGGAEAATAPVEVITAQTPWRAYLVQGAVINVRPEGLIGSGQSLMSGQSLTSGQRFSLADDGQRFEVTRMRGAQAVGEAVPVDPRQPNEWFTVLPPKDWAGTTFEDRHWARYQMDELKEFISGDYGVSVWRSTPVVLYLRTRFGVADPARATDLRVTVTGIGGGVVYVNGVEVGRGYMPAGDLHPLAFANTYPLSAYTIEDNETPLPGLGSITTAPEEKWLPRYQERIRAWTVEIPARVLVKGTNVLAIEMRQSPVAGPSDRYPWCHLGVHQVRVTSPSGAGVLAYAEAVRGTRLWSAHAVEQVTDVLPEQSLLRRNWFHDVNTRGMPVKGTALPTPYDPVHPVRILAPRNGVGSGQAVVSDPAGLRDVSASLGTWSGPGGATLPSGAVRIRYGAQQETVHYCDALMSIPPAQARTVPVWLLVEAPRGQAPGWYTTTLTVRANGQSFTVPVQVLVTAFVLPDPTAFRSLLGVMHSPDTVAMAYEVAPWSDKHFRLMEKSVELAGQLGNNILYVPVILDERRLNYRTGMIRWVRTEQGPQPDYSIFERYLDLYLKHNAPPKAIVLYIWTEGSSSEVAGAREGGQNPLVKRANPGRRQVSLWDPETGEHSALTVPTLLDEGAEAFWKPMLDGVRDIVVRKRGWPESVIMLGTGGDARPSVNASAAARRIAPWARWNLYSHFSGDPGSTYYNRLRQADDPTLKALAAGKLIAIGGVEVGLKEVYSFDAFTARQWRQYWEEQARNEFLELLVTRLQWNDQSAPLVHRTLLMFKGRQARLGLDFWPVEGRRGGFQTWIWGAHPQQLAWAGPDGAEPTVRFQMIRESLQDIEARWVLLDALEKMSDNERQAATALFDELQTRIALSSHLSQAELGLDWPGYVARIYQAAGRAAGAPDTARWDQPPQ